MPAAAAPPAPPPPPPLVRNTGLFGGSARRRLRGPQEHSLKEQVHRDVLRPTTTTVSQDGVVHFGDSLLLLSHQTEVLLLGDASRRMRVVDDSHTQRREFEAHPLTTGLVLRPCARSVFSAARADRDDGYGDGLELHYGQGFRLLACSSLGGGLLYLHVAEPTGLGTPVLLPRAAPRTRWRALPLRPEPGRPAPAVGDAVRVNERVMLQNAETGQLLCTSTESLPETPWGVECHVTAEPVSPRAVPLPEPRCDPAGREGSDLSEAGRPAVWSFVTEAWCDAVAEAEGTRVTVATWREDEGDDFAEEHRMRARQAAHDVSRALPAFAQPRGAERQGVDILFSQLQGTPGARVLERKVFPALRAQGIHGPRRLKRQCALADLRLDGTVGARTFEGLLAGVHERMSARELADVCRGFGRPELPDSIDYEKVFLFMGGGVLPDFRLDVVRRAYGSFLRTSGRDYVIVDDLTQAWNPRGNPLVAAGEMDAKSAYQDFAAQWQLESSDGRVSPEEFLEYCRDVSMAFEDGDEFIRVMRAAWNL